MGQLKTVYDSDGKCLGDEFVDLSPLQADTKLAIVQIIYLDKAVDIAMEAMQGARQELNE